VFICYDFFEKFFPQVNEFLFWFVFLLNFKFVSKENKNYTFLIFYPSQMGWLKKAAFEEKFFYFYIE
jgi:hypothetical protein